jgi:hypothetical protein
MNSQNVAEFHFQNQRGLRQTSFQRLILHRLADRFGIIREVIPQNENIVTSLNLIRLIKTEASGLPQRLLMDVDLGLLVDYKNPLARADRQNVMGCAANEEEVKLLSDSMNSTNLDNPNTVKKKKMVIMKRNSTDSSQPGTMKKEGKSRSRKKLVDKEKAYEEARARIFGVDKGDSEDGTGDGAAAAEAVNDDAVATNNEETTTGKPRLNPQVAEFSPQSLSDSHHSIASINENNEPVASGESEEAEEDKEETTTASIQKEHKEDKDVSSEEGNTKPTKQKKAPKSQDKQSKSTGKAVYRNRQQEEADPDFKRRSGPTYYTPYTSNPYAPNPYNAMVNVAMAPNGMGHVAMQQYYAQNGYYSNMHMTTPQSPAYFVGQGGYPTNPPAQATNAATQNQATNAPTLQHKNTQNTNDVSIKSNELMNKPQVLQKPKYDNGSSGACGEQVVALKPEDFPALR